MRQRRSLPPTRGHRVLSLRVHRSSVFTCSDRGLSVSIHTAFCAAQASATVSGDCPFSSNRAKPRTLGLENTVTWL